MKDWDSVATVKQVVLERLQHHMTSALNGELLRNCRSDTFLAPHFDGVITQLLLSVMGQHVEMIKVEYPRDWWQAFKERWFPNWWLRRWPAEMTYRTLAADVVYPKIELPRERHAVIMLLDGKPQLTHDRREGGL